MSAVSCGGRHTAAVSNEGDLYCWGDSSSGQCGTGDYAIYTTPQLIHITNNESKQHKLIDNEEESSLSIHAVSCGDKHTIAITEEGQLWSWGTGLQLGLSKNVCIASPEQVPFLQGRRVLMVSSGAEHSIAIVEKIGAKFKKHRNASRRVIAHVDRPSTCSNCEEDIFTVTVKNDMCVINGDHKCVEEVAEELTERLIKKKSSDASLEDQQNGISSEIELQKYNEEQNIISDEKVKHDEEIETAFDAPQTEDVTSHTDAVEVENDNNEANVNEVKLTLALPQTINTKLQKSRSSFLDETQALEYLDRQLYGSNVDMTKSGLTDEEELESPMSSPFVQKVGNIRQYVPAPPVAVQESVSLFTKSMVSNIKTSWDKFGFVSPQDALVFDMISQSSSQDSLSVFSKDSSLSSSKGDLSAASQGSISKSQSMGSFRLASKLTDLERKHSLPVTACTHSFGK